MYIAFIGQKGIPATTGGVEKHVEDLARQLKRQGHRVLVYTRPNYTDKNLKNWQGIELVSLPSIPTKHLDAISHTFLACFDVARRRQVEIIHFHSIGPSLLIWLVKLLRPRTPVVATFHTQCYFHQKWGRLARWALRTGEAMCCLLADRIITVSKTLRAYAQKKYKRQAVYIPNGVGATEYLEPKIIKEKWGLSKGGYILYLGRLVQHKGVHYLIQAYQKLAPEKKLVIVGDSAFTNDYVRQLHKLAQANPNIIFTGTQSGSVKKELLSNAYLFVQPSESEGLSIALLEAMAYGLPILSSDIAENKEPLANGGLFFANKDENDLAQKLEYALANPAKIKALGKIAQARAQADYAWDKIALKVLAIYRQELDRQAKQRLCFPRLSYFKKQFKSLVGLIK